MKACDKKLRDSILRVMNEEDAAIEEEMKQSEPHVFSESFEKKMEELSLKLNLNTIICSV